MLRLKFCVAVLVFFPMINLKVNGCRTMSLLYNCVNKCITLKTSLYKYTAIFGQLIKCSKHITLIRNFDLLHSNPFSFITTCYIER